jgi:hypothetical protein
LPNSQEGVLIDLGAGNTVGGTTSAARNVISANHWGVRINGSTANANVVEGNFIGTDVSGTHPLGNEVNGVIITGQASGNLIGGASTSAGNIIASNTAAGVSIQSGISDGILTNSIFANGTFGIELLPGANHSQPAPVITSVQSVFGGTNIAGTLDGTPNTAYTIQMFSNAAPGPGGFGQGQTFMGSINATTNASGHAQFAGSVPVSVSPAQPYITATATSVTGDTSEFSRAVTPTPLTVAFATASYSVSQTAGTVTITVVRSGGGPADTVAYATANGTAKAGTDYIAASGVLSFQPGQTQLTITIVILNAQHVGGSRNFAVALSNPTGGLTLGSPSTATVSILGYTTPGPRVVSAQLLPATGPITGIVLGFSEPLIPSRATNLLNYGYSVQIAPNGLDGIASATYNPANHSVTLRLQVPISSSASFRLSINQSTDTPTVPVGVADTSGNLLDGNNDGVPGGVFTATFARGQNLTFLDNHGNQVKLRLTGGGTIDLIRRADGGAWELDLAGVVPGRSSLSGQVRKTSRAATGITAIPSIVGASGVRIQFARPSFAVGSVIGSSVKEPAKTAAKRNPSKPSRAVLPWSRMLLVRRQRGQRQ